MKDIILFAIAGLLEQEVWSTVFPITVKCLKYLYAKNSRSGYKYKSSFWIL